MNDESADQSAQTHSFLRQSQHPSGRLKPPCLLLPPQIGDGLLQQLNFQVFLFSLLEVGAVPYLRKQGASREPAVGGVLGSVGAAAGEGCEERAGGGMLRTAQLFVLQLSLGGG